MSPGRGQADRFDPYQWGVRASIRVLSVGGSMLLGAGILIGGPGRFSAPSFETARQVPGEHLTWGFLFLAAGAVTGAGILAGWRRRLVMAGLAAQSALASFLAVSLAMTAAMNPAIPYTGVVAYGSLAALSVVAWVTGHALHPADPSYLARLRAGRDAAGE